MQPSTRRTWLAVAAIAIISCLGCGRKLSEVHGRVTVAGVPLSNAIVYFVPASGPQAQARLNMDGTYQLTTPGIGGGALPGPYQVYFAPAISDQDEATKESFSQQDYNAGRLPKITTSHSKAVLPAKYCSVTNGELRREVKPGSNELNFELTK